MTNVVNLEFLKSFEEKLLLLTDLFIDLIKA